MSVQGAALFVDLVFLFIFSTRQELQALASFLELLPQSLSLQSL